MFQNVSVNLNELPQVEEVQFEGISPKFKIIQLLISAFFAVIAMIIASIVITNAQEYEYIVSGSIAGAGVLFFLIRTFVVWKGYPHKGYALREKDVIYKSGWIFRSTVVIPFARIQHGELSEGLIDRYFKVKRLKIFTAGGSSSDLSIPSLPSERAERLRKYIMERVIEEAEHAEEDAKTTSDYTNSEQV